MMNTRICLLAVSVIVISHPCTAATIFTSDFSGATLPIELTETSPGSILVSGGQATMAIGSGRQNAITVDADYTDFEYELTVNITNSPVDIAFVGVGTGTPAAPNQEPGLGSLRFRIHSPALGGQVDLMFDNGPFFVGGLANVGASTGPHRTRIVRTGDIIDFSFDVDYNGTFSADGSYSLDLTTEPTIKTALDTESRMFFGGAFSSSSFDDISVVPEPSTSAIVTFALLAGMIFRRRLI